MWRCTLKKQASHQRETQQETTNASGVVVLDCTLRSSVQRPGSSATTLEGLVITQQLVWLDAHNHEDNQCRNRPPQRREQQTQKSLSEKPIGQRIGNHDSLQHPWMDVRSISRWIRKPMSVWYLLHSTTAATLRKQDTDKRLFGPGRMPIKTKGMFGAPMSRQDKETRQRIFKVEGLQRVLPRWPAICAPSVLTHLEAVEEETQDRTQKGKSPKERPDFCPMFTGIG